MTIRWYVLIMIYLLPIVSLLLVLPLPLVRRERIRIRRHPMDQIRDINRHRAFEREVHRNEASVLIFVANFCVRSSFLLPLISTTLHDDLQHVLLRAPFQESPDVLAPVIKLPLVVFDVSLVLQRQSMRRTSNSVCWAGF